MKSLSILILLFLSQVSFALSDAVVIKLVKEDIRSGQLISGKRSVETLKMNSCSETECELSFSYFVDGCSPYGDYCFDLKCSGKIAFDLNEVESAVKDQECVDL
jgi:hypothetical protein